MEFMSTLWCQYLLIVLLVRFKWINPSADPAQRFFWLSKKTFLMFLIVWWTYIFDLVGSQEKEYGKSRVKNQKPAAVQNFFFFCNITKELGLKGKPDFNRAQILSSSFIYLVYFNDYLLLSRWRSSKSNFRVAWVDGDGWNGGVDRWRNETPEVVVVHIIANPGGCNC